MKPKRTKPLALHRLALGAAIALIAAILVPAASAKPAPVEVAPLVTLGPGEIPQVAAIRLGPGEIPHVDYATPVAAAPVADGGYVGLGIAGSAVMLVLLAGAGASVAIRHSRKTRLSPA
jgi:hypothetical protein